KASIAKLKLTAGRDVKGGAIFNGGTLTLDHDLLTQNTARGPDGDFADGGDGFGGAIYNVAALTVIACQITNNTARGGDGELGLTEGNAGNASGGAIYNDIKAKLTIS